MDGSQPLTPLRPRTTQADSPDAADLPYRAFRTDLSGHSMLRWRLTLGVAIVAGRRCCAGSMRGPPRRGGGCFRSGSWSRRWPETNSGGWPDAAGRRPPRLLMVGGCGRRRARRDSSQVYEVPEAPAGLDVFGCAAAALALTAIAAFAVEIVRYEQPGQATASVRWCCYPQSTSACLAALLQLRLLGRRTPGLLALVSLIAVVKAGDIGAYTGGRLFGRHKMAPQLSPGKTLEAPPRACCSPCSRGWACSTD